MNAQTMKCGSTPANDVYTETVMVTPEIAAQWLKLNVVNRPIVRKNVDAIKWDIRHDKWVLTHQGVAFNCDLNLIDGQHRLTAIAEGTIAVPMRVTYNVNATYYAPIDTGRVRTAANVLNMPPRAVATCNALALLLSGVDEKTSAAKAAEVYEKHALGVDWAMRTFPSQRRMTASLVAAHAYAYPVAPDHIHDYARKLTSYTADGSHSPIVALRRHIERLPGSTTAARLQLSLMTLRCLQAHCEGEPLAKVYENDLGLRYFAARRMTIGV
jgi:hypothetical protein